MAIGLAVAVLERISSELHEMTKANKIAVVAGVGPGLGTALCEKLTESGYCVAGIARSSATGESLLKQLGADRFVPVACDISDPTAVNAAFATVEQHFGAPDVYIHNVAGLLRQPFLETRPEQFETLWRSQCLGAVYGAQRALPAMLRGGNGTLLFIGATASVKPGAHFSAFGVAKSALRGLAQSLARELGPQGIHVAHLIIDGVLWGERARDAFGMGPEACLQPDAVAQTCMHLIEQDRSAWTMEIDIRPDREAF